MAECPKTSKSGSANDIKKGIFYSLFFLELFVVFACKNREFVIYCAKSIIVNLIVCIMKQKILGFVAILVLCVATSCITENTLPINLQVHNDKSSTIPVAQAIEDLNMFLIRQGQMTKAAGVTMADVEVVSSRNITRSNGDSLPTVDSLLYLVNFENESGYAILSADERIGTPIIAVTETGNIDVQSFNFNNRNIEIGSSADDLSIDLPIFNDTNSFENTIVDVKTPIVTDMIVDFVSGKIVNRRPIISGNVGSTSTNPYWVAPILTTIWGQYDPYNLKCPDDNGKHNPAGCVAIAIGQVVAHFEAERTDKNKSYDWQVIKSVGKIADWQAIRSGNVSYNNTQCDEISTFIRDIGDMCCMDYGVDGSSSLPWKINNCLEDFGFENCDFYWGYDIDDIKSSLVRGYPVIISAARQVFGHTWVIDGYDTRYNPDDEDNNIIVHCNWGWNGECNGFYYSGVFDLSNGAVVVDGNYGDVADSADRNYNWMFSTVLLDVKS